MPMTPEFMSFIEKPTRLPLSWMSEVSIPPTAIPSAFNRRITSFMIVDFPIFGFPVIPTLIFTSSLIKR
jgi:hypothetical protein